MGLSLDLKVDGSGNVAVNGYERLDMDSPVWRGFTLRNARIQRALTGTKVYANGTTEPFEGVFINRTSFESPTDSGSDDIWTGCSRGYRDKS